MTGARAFDARQKAAVDRALDVLEANPPVGLDDIGAIAVGCALGYLDFRFAAEPWRDAHPTPGRLVRRGVDAAAAVAHRAGRLMVDLRDPSVTAAQVIAALDLRPHPEGGHYRETWRDAPADGSRGAGTAILFLLAAR